MRQDWDPYTGDPINPIESLEIGESCLVPWIPSWSPDELISLVCLAVDQIEETSRMEFTGIAMPQGIIVERILPKSRECNHFYIVDKLPKLEN